MTISHGATGGLSRARLDRLTGVMQSYVERGEVVGVITALARHGELVHLDVLGRQDRERSLPLQRNTIHRIASMTKPITAVAAMILVEEGKLRLDDPVDRFLPELADRRVLRQPDAALDDTVAALRPITLRDLLTFRVGIGMQFGPNETPLQKAMREQQIMGLKPPVPFGPDEWLKRLGGLPLMAQPGERWLYHTGSDILGVLIARVAGQPIESFFRERIFGPLGMVDTSFSVPEDKLGRFAACYAVDAEGGLKLYDDARDSTWARPPVFPAAGGGLVSTIDDYLAFGQMMLNHGTLNGTRILARPTVELMATDQLTAAQKAASPFAGPDWWSARGWGLGMSVVTRRESIAGTPGRFGWDGAFGTQWASDPREDMVSILFIQRLPMMLGSGGIGQDFWTLAYQAIDD